MMRFVPVTFLLIITLSLAIYPSIVLADDKEEGVKLDKLLNKLIDISLLLVSLQKQITELINTSEPLYHLNLGDYLKDLFEERGIILNENDFLKPTEDPYLDFAKILNLIPSSYRGNKKIAQREAEQISEKLLSITQAIARGEDEHSSSTKDKLLFDGLYGKIDMHEHYRFGGNIEDFLKAAGRAGISKTVFVPTGLGPDNAGYKTHQSFLVKYIKELYPDKIIPFCTVDEANPEAAEIFEDCLQSGGEGLKLLGGHPSFYDEPLDSKNMYKVYEVADKYQAPILVHGSIINVPETKNQLEKVYGDFPEVTFIHAHYCSAIFSGINLDQCAELLDKYPNLYIDLSMGGGIKRYHRYLREDLNKIKDFVITYQDRILFGSDIILDDAEYKDDEWLYQRIRCDIDLHQQEEYTCAFGEEGILHQGFNLDKEVLKKLYFENPKKVLNL